MNSIADGPRVVRCQRMTANFDVVPGVLILGDALNTRHPVTASGMTAALNDVMFWWKVFTQEIQSFSEYLNPHGALFLLIIG